jgi:hypothetical protein
MPLFVAVGVEGGYNTVGLCTMMCGRNGPQKFMPIILWCGNSHCIDPLFMMWYEVRAAGELQARHF